jgi:hypothetical protein
VGEDLAAEQERIRRRLVEDEPTFVVFSGGGYQAFWRLREPVDVSTPEGRASVRDRNKGIEVALGGDSCHNLDRIMRLPGTVNIPTAKKVEKGRRETLARVEVAALERVFDLGDFRPASTNGTKPTVLDPGNVQRLAGVEDLDKWPQVSDRVKVVIVQGEDVDNPKEGDNSRSAWLFDVCCQLVRAGVPDDVIYSIITDPDFLISSSVLDKAPRIHEYAVRQIERAREEVEEPGLRELNDRFFIVGNYAGKCVVAEPHDRPEAGLPESHSIQSRDNFRARYSHRRVELGKKSAELGAWWLKHPKARRFERIVFAPGEELPPDVYNLWRGFAVEPRPGDWSLFEAHLRDNVAGEHANWLLNWMARAVQQPGVPAEIAVVMRGGRGVGKTIVAEQFGALFGPHYLAISNAKHLVGNFNAHLEDCVVLLADEAFYAGDKRHESVLKSLITSSTLAIERKGFDLRTARNCIHLMMTSNEGWVVPAGLDERRFLVLDVERTRQRDRDYFGALVEQMAHGGREAMLHDLLARDLSEFDHRAAPDTRGLTDQKVRSLPPLRRRVYDMLATGWHPQFKARGGEVFVPTAALADRWGESMKGVATELEHLSVQGASLRERIDGERVRGYWLDALPLAREKWARAHGLDIDWEGDVFEWDGAEDESPM